MFGASHRVLACAYIKTPFVNRMLGRWEMRQLRSGRRCFRRNIQSVRAEERSKVHLRGGEDGSGFSTTCFCKETERGKSHLKRGGEVKKERGETDK